MRVCYFSGFYLPKGTRILLYGMPGVPLMMHRGITFTTASQSTTSCSVLCVKSNKMKSAHMVPPACSDKLHIMPTSASLVTVSHSLPRKHLSAVCFLPVQQSPPLFFFLERMPSYSCVVQPFPALSSYLWGRFSFLLPLPRQS